MLLICQNTLDTSPAGVQAIFAVLSFCASLFIIYFTWSIAKETKSYVEVTKKSLAFIIEKEKPFLYIKSVDDGSIYSNISVLLHIKNGGSALAVITHYDILWTALHARGEGSPDLKHEVGHPPSFNDLFIPTGEERSQTITFAPQKKEFKGYFGSLAIQIHYKGIRDEKYTYTSEWNRINTDIFERMNEYHRDHSQQDNGYSTQESIVAAKIAFSSTPVSQEDPS